MNNEEKLKEAKRLYQTANFDQRYVLESLFPELKESEDERIRETLIRFHKSTIDVDGIKGEDIIAWLEKQGGCEHIKKEWTTSDAATLKELIDFLENGTAKLQHDLTRYVNWLKIQFTPIENQSNYVEKYPDIRFGQMLFNLDIKPHFDEESKETYCNLNETINKKS